MLSYFTHIERLRLALIIGLSTVLSAACGGNVDSSASTSQQFNQSGVWYQVSALEEGNSAIEPAAVQFLGSLTAVAVVPGKQVYWTVPVQVDDGAKTFHGLVSRDGFTQHQQGVLNYTLQIQTADSFPTLATGQLSAEQMSASFSTDLSAYENQTVLVIISLSTTLAPIDASLSQLGLY